jgi:hypothetical protein
MATSGNGRPEQRLGTTLSDRGLIAQGGFQGRAYIFLRRWGANGLGHVGWGYRVSQSEYDCGSMENNSGNPTRYFWVSDTFSGSPGGTSAPGAALSPSSRGR